jgi:hypothetical protein
MLTAAYRGAGGEDISIRRWQEAAPERYAATAGMIAD